MPIAGKAVAELQRSRFCHDALVNSQRDMRPLATCGSRGRPLGRVVSGKKN